MKMKEETEVLFSRFVIYVAGIFSSFLWEAFTVSYKTSTEPFQYYPIRHYAIERGTSTIAFKESFDHEFAKCGLTDDMIEIPFVIEFNLVHQVTMHICSDIVGFLGDENGDSGTFRSGLV